MVYKKPKKNILKKLLSVLAFFLALSVLSLGVNYWAYVEIQKRLKVQMHGKYVPNILIPSFEVRAANFIWEDKVQLLAGDFKVNFDPLSMVSQRGLRIVVTSKGSQIKFLGSWALQEGIENATVDSMVADIVLGRRGLAGINEIEVLSPSFQFSLKNADKKS